MSSTKWIQFNQYGVQWLIQNKFNYFISLQQKCHLNHNAESFNYSLIRQPNEDQILGCCIVIVIFNIKGKMLSAAIIGDYYGYNSIVSRGTRVRRMHRTEVSADKIINSKLRMISEEKSESLRAGDLIGMSSQSNLKDHNKMSSNGLGQNAVKRRRFYQQRKTPQPDHSRFNHQSQNFNEATRTKNDKKSLAEKDKTEGYYFGGAQHGEKGLAKKRSRIKIQNKEQVLPRPSLNVQSRGEVISSEYYLSEIPAKKIKKQQNCFQPYGIVPITAMLVSQKRANIKAGEKGKNEKALRSRKWQAGAREVEKQQNIINDTQTMEKDNRSGVGRSLLSQQNKDSGLDIFQNTDDYVDMRSKTTSDIFSKKQSKREAGKLSKSLTPSESGMFNQQDNILIEEIEVAEKSKMQYLRLKQEGQLEDGNLQSNSQRKQTSGHYEKVKIEIREETGKAMGSSGNSNIRITMKSAETEESNNMIGSKERRNDFDSISKAQNQSLKTSEARYKTASKENDQILFLLNKTQEPNNNCNEGGKIEQSICSLSVESQESEMAHHQSKTDRQLVVFAEQAVKVKNKMNFNKKLPLAGHQGEHQQRFHRQPLPYSFRAVVKKIVEHDTRIGFLYLFVSNTKNAYQGTLKYERYERLCFLMLKKYLFEKQRMIKSLKGQQTSFTLTGVAIPSEALRQYADRQEMQQRLNALMSQQHEIFKELENEYKRICCKYAKDRYIRLEITRDIFEKEIMRLLMEELSRLYGQLRGDEADVDRIDSTEQRFVEIVEIMFLLSELSGRQVKPFALLSDTSPNFDLYYSDNYQKIIQTTEYFQYL